MLSRAVIVLLGVLLVGCATGQPVTPQAPGPAVDQALRDMPPGRCRAQVERELQQGRRLEEGCQETRAVATRRLGRAERSRVFGVIDRQEVRVDGIRLVLSKATRCGHWPLRGPAQGRLRPGDALRADCRLRRYHGSVPVSLVDHAGTVHPISTLRTDEDGRVELSFVELHRSLRARGLDAGLEPFSQLRFGNGGWAGIIDLTRFRALMADLHFAWVERGRGSPRLFAVRHPEHAESGTARALALELSLARQERDYLAVAAGMLTPEAFLERYPWSPYRLSVAAMEGR